MGVNRQVIVDGVAFPSIKEAAQHYGVREQTAARRLRTGWTPEQAFEVDPKPSRGVAHDASQILTSQGAYSSYREAAKAFGLNWQTIQARITRGWSHDQAVGLAPPPPTNQGRSYSVVTCEGKTFRSISVLAREYSVAPKTVRKRLSAGWSTEQAVGIDEPPPRFRGHYGHARSHIYRDPMRLDGRIVPGAPPGSYRLYRIVNKRNGKEYVGITTNDLKARLRGHKRQASLGTKGKLYNAIRRYGPGAFKIQLIRDDAADFGELETQEIEEIARRNTIAKGYNTATGGSIGTSEPIKIDGIQFPSRQSAANHFGIDPRVFNIRLGRLGWSPEEAAGIKKRRYGRHSVEVDGKVFPSLKRAAEAFGLSYKVVHARVNRSGWTYEQALGLKPAPVTSAS